MWYIALRKRPNNSVLTLDQNIVVANVSAKVGGVMSASAPGQLQRNEKQII